jgi:hypothetical protein
MLCEQAVGVAAGVGLVDVEDVKDAPCGEWQI